MRFEISRLSGRATAIPARASETLAVLRQRNLGLVWSAITLAGLGSQMEQLVLAWFVLVLTGSPFLVGLASSARMGANFLALFAGALVDRMSRRLLLAAVQFTIASLALLVLALVLTGLLEVWHLFVIALASGLARIFDMPLGQSLMADSVDKDRIANGVALTNAGMNLTIVVGPLLGGVVFQAAGPAGAYALIALAHILSAGCALAVRITEAKKTGPSPSVLRSVGQGLKYVGRNQVLLVVLLVAAVINLTAFPFTTTLMPIFAKDVLDTGSAGLGMLMSAFGVGAVIGSVGLASVRNLKNGGRLLIAAVVAWHLMMVVFAASTNFPLALLFLVITGAAYASTLVLILTLLLGNSLAEFRGRIVGLRVLAIYAHPVGSMASGAMAGVMGAPFTAVINGVTGLGLLAVLTLLMPRLRRA